MLMCSGVESGQKRFEAGAAAREGTGGRYRPCKQKCAGILACVALSCAELKSSNAPSLSPMSLQHYCMHAYMAEGDGFSDMVLI